MKLPILLSCLLPLGLLGACNKPADVVQPVIVQGAPGPTGDTGATGQPGEAGKTGTDTTVIVVPPPAASAASN